MKSVAVSSALPQLQADAHALAAELELPYTEPVPGQEDHAALLELGDDGLLLRPLGKGAPGPVRVDFGAGQMRHRRRGGHNEPLGRAVGVSRWPGQRVLDATAGLGCDSFVLADLGCEVIMLERSPLVFALLRDGLQRARESTDTWLRSVCSRLLLHRADSLEWMQAQAQPVADVIYLDPMFPPRKKSARAKKEMWMFQHLLPADDGCAELFRRSLEMAARRVVVKRPLRAPFLCDREPHFALTGKTVRFDVYTAANPPCPGH